MPAPRTASALIVATWLIEGACAQQASSGVPAAASPSPTVAQTGAPEAGAEDDATRSADWRQRVDAARQRRGDWLACVAAKGRECSRAPTPDPMDALLDDDTLVNGDVVSTPSGLKVFHGQPATPHSLADFQ